MVIAIDASRANSKERTGTEWYAFHVIKKLQSIIPNTETVILYVKEPLLLDLQPMPSNWHSIVLHWPPKILWTQLRLSIALLRQRPDVLYIPAHSIPLIHPKRTVVVVHDIGFLQHKKLYGTSAIPKSSSLVQRVMDAMVRVVTLGRYTSSEGDYQRYAMHQAVKHASEVVTVSQFSKQEILHAYPELQSRVSVIYNGRTPIVAVSDFKGIAERLRIHQPYILYIGRIEQKKNIPRLIHAFAQFHQHHPSFQLVVCGKNGFGYDEVLQNIRASELTAFVRLTGWLNTSDVESLRQHAHLMILPSLYEGFGIPVVEAMDANVPIVCSDIPALREVAGDAALYCNPYNTEDIAHALEQASTNSALREQLRSSGKKRVEKFDWNITAQQTWNIIRRDSHTP